ncbi:hypothetical protein PSHT_13701 [Puccinia striiformis]|uniref:Uncharacterized protein n=1 Tax=Puccinia striiformis TaxID=27350 RepID=A0A2S4UP53_9BASI|nr:hypothetical protein PSHT_13701 [Puccinia striiformis]
MTGRHKIILRDSDSLNPLLNRFDPRGSNLSPAISKMYDDDKIDYERVKYLVTSVWVLNSRLIEACGYTTEEPEYLEEQIHLQDEMFKILNHPRDQAELSGSSKSKDDPSSTEKVLSDLIFSALKCKITSKTYRSTFKTIQITLSKQDTTMAEAAVRMIAYHYQKKNIVKWFNLFKDEDGFINCFQRIAFRIRTMKSHKAFLSTAFISIREIQLLPWKDAMYTTAKQRLLHAHVSSRAPPGSPLLLPSPGDGEGSGVTTKVPLTQDEEIAEAHEASIALLELRDHVVSLPEIEENNQVIRILKRKRNKQPGPRKTQDHGTVNVIKDSKSKGKASVFEDPLRKTKTTAEMIYLFHSSHTEKIWAWIYGGTTCVIDKDDLRLRRLSDSRYVSELASIMDQNIRQKGHHPPEGMISASEVHDNVSHFVEQMLLTNLRLLRGLGTVSEKIYVDELESLHRWLVNILTEEHNQPPAHIDQSKVEIFPGLNLKQLVDSVSLVLSSKSTDKLVHTLVKKEKVIHSFISVISEQQLLMVKTVVTLSASYYRLQNPEKWGFLYQDEGVFLSYLAKLQSPYIRSDIQVLAQPKTFMDVLKLLPWTNEWEYHPGSKSRSLAMSMSLSSRTNWDDWVEPFEMGVPAVIGYDVWATISLIGRGEEGIILEDSASFNPVLNRFQPKETTNMLSQTFLKMCNDRQITFPEVKYFVSLVWILHSRLIEAFGYQPKDPVYLEEQNQLQTEMFEILNQPRDHGKLSEGLAEGPTIDIADERKVLSDMIFSSLMCKETTRVYLPSYPVKKRVSQQEIQMARAAVRMIGHHYQKKNLVKWLNLFKNEEGFITAFENIGKRIKNNRSYQSFTYVTAKAMREIELLPWENTMYATGKQRQLYAIIFRVK